MITGIEHIAIASLHPYDLAAWYIENLDFSMVLDTGKTVYIRSLNHVILEFVYADAEPAKPLIRDAGLRHIALSVDNIDAAYEKLKSKGARFADERIELPGARIHFFQDPEGNFLHLVQRDTALI